MGDLIYRLLIFLNSSKTKDLNYTIATTLLHNIKQIPNMNINKLADICYTSPAAITRFCHKLGYANLAEFKKNLEFSLDSYEKGLMKPKALNIPLSREEIFDNISEEINVELSRFKDSIDLKVIDNIIELIYSNSNVCIFGTQFSQLISQELQRRLANLGKIINHAIDVQDQEVLANSLTENSLAILVSPTGLFKIYHERLWKKIKGSNSTLVIITADNNHEYSVNANYLIKLNSDPSNLYIQTHRYALTYLIEYIYIRYGSLYTNNKARV